MAEQPPPTPSELLRMVTELRQAMAEENQRMANQIANLNNTRTENNNDRQERTEEAEQQLGPTHVSDTARQEEEQPEHNEEAQKDIENDDQESSPGPFTEEVMNFVLPRRFTLSTTLTPYDGLGDPKKYIKKFTSIIIVNGASDKVLYRCFPSYLDGPALDWFCSLPAGSISRFRDISKPFEEHFAGSAIYLHDSDYLNTVKQGQHESLKDYMTRFTKIAIRQIDIEELRQARKVEKPHYRDDDKTWDSKKNFKPIPRYETYTKFNTKRDDIIKEILNSKLIKPPRKASSYPDSKGTDRSKYCSFHQKHGHNTDDCIIAKDLLERLARQGHLDKYISSHTQRRAPPSGDQSLVTQHGRDRDRPNNSHPELPTRTINCISGGFAGGGATSSARKRSYRAILSINADQSQQQPLPRSPQITFQTADHDTSVANLDDPVDNTIATDFWPTLLPNSQYRVQLKTTSNGLHTSTDPPTHKGVEQHIPRESNGRADILSKLASTQPNGSSLYQSTLLKPSIELTQVLSVTQEADWRSPYIQYLQTGILPGNVENARHFHR
ncbi:uncharacterized protein LOC107607112 [Arachis ipaensis]|uniref:uncharacterized protein LOC107607112 n=1 Tax=Arachis ipaensis TaxID=130454 RepID=UPI0007AF0033|nr:uncharacterized protein LOC107607112 [Arachis ipaensis]